ncbi:alpha/beta fold hydrolase [Martelella mediterranea]|uniref:Fluoroacetate dehalogenase n=1 Tax=Martelella mediterranea DSM 17316 TaxID=1122214 RepID=A0A1U9YYG0_9HYPH|nr:alpha/beta hydrolase [Martelella mediterranea]AQZ50483.1 Fluoroacetate dehalogenase [Martelella mediterranea DSM 17316]
MPQTYAPEREFDRGKIARLGDIDIYHEEHGAGAPLVLLHGFGGSVRNWYPFIEALSKRHRLILVDLRGHGHSTNPVAAFTHRDAAGDVFRLLDTLNVDRFSAMGMSTGGMTLLHMATSQPGRIASMVLVSATTHFPEQARTIMRRASFATMPAPVQAMYRECATRGDRQIETLIGQFNALGDDRDDMNFTAGELAAISARTLVVHGDRDRFFPVEIAVDLYRGIPDAALWVIPGGEHVPVHDANVHFADTALRFFETGNHARA